MPTSYRGQIFLTLILFIVVLFVLTGLITVRIVENHQLKTIRDALIRQTETIAMLLSKQASAAGRITPEVVSLIDELHESIGARVTLIDPDGRVLADSAADARTMDNHAGRPEVSEAQDNRYGMSVRQSSTTSEKTLYIAMKIKLLSGPEGQVARSEIGFLRLANSLHEVESTSALIIRYLLLMLLLLFLISAYVSWRIARSLSQPIGELQTAAEQIMQGNYGYRVADRRSNEWGQLADSINEMADSLERQMLRITVSENRLRNVVDHLSVGVVLTDYEGEILLYNPFIERFRRSSAEGETMAESLQGSKLDELDVPLEFVREWRAALAKQLDQRCEVRTYYPDERILDVHFIPIMSGMVVMMQDLTPIRRLEKMRSEFVANVSHELRTPLAAIRGFAETLKMGALHDPDSAEAFIQIIMDESDRLNRLVNDLLELSRIESKRLPLMYENVRVAELVSDVSELLAQEREKKSIDLAASGDDQLMVEADRDRLRQILINLVQNAIQYTPAGGQITVSWRTDDSMFRIDVRDNGIGIPEEDVPHLFERFFRVDKARSRQSGGTGLGLSISKHLIELHRGTITVESSIGAGSCFTVMLPLTYG